MVQKIVMGVTKVKKQYTKPEIYVEEFKISQNIATACGVPGGGTSTGRPRYADGYSCAWDVNGWKIFIESTVCTDEQYGEDEPYDGMCYNNPVAGNSVFASY